MHCTSRRFITFKLHDSLRQILRMLLVALNPICKHARLLMNNSRSLREISQNTFLQYVVVPHC